MRELDEAMAGPVSPLAFATAASDAGALLIQQGEALVDAEGLECFGLIAPECLGPTPAFCVHVPLGKRNQVDKTVDPVH